MVEKRYYWHAVFCVFLFCFVLLCCHRNFWPVSKENMEVIVEKRLCNERVGACD